MMHDTSPILIVDDEPDLRQLLAINLQRAGFSTVMATNGAEALQLAEESSPQCILLDLMLPDMSGNEVCRRLKGNEGTSSIPVIMISARGEEIDRVVGFELGADDYVVKSNLSIRELILRIRAVLRRYAHSAKSVGTLPLATGTVTFGTLEIQFESHRVWTSGQEVFLTATEFKLLRTMVGSPGRVMTRGFLLQEVWDMPPDLNTRTVDTHVKRLREKLKSASTYIETVRGVGYRFIAKLDGSAE